MASMTDPTIDKRIREEIANEAWRLFSQLSGRIAILYDDYAIQITVFPMRGAHFDITAGPVIGTIKDFKTYTEEEHADS